MVRLFNHYFSERKALLFVVENLSFVAVMAVGMVISFVQLAARMPSALWGRYWLVVSLAVVGYTYFLYWFDLYDLPSVRLDNVQGGRHLQASGVLALFIAILVQMLPGQMTWFPGATLLFVFTAVVVSRNVRSEIWPKFQSPKKVLLVGHSTQTECLLSHITEEGDGEFAVQGVLGLKTLEAPSVEATPSKSNWLRSTIQHLGAEWVVVGERAYLESQETTRRQLEHLLLECRRNGIPVFSATEFAERAFRKLPVDSMDAFSMALDAKFQSSMMTRLVKRASDLILATLLLVLAFPLGVIVALAIRLDSKGPIFYRQERVGKNGRTFRLWKFRSMKTDAERNGAVWAKLHDDRVTRVGRLIRKTRIDEIPQVLNVLAGEMSFVGPRPERPIFVEEIERFVPFYRLREHVKPGLTGWAQIRYPYGASVEDAKRKLEYDLYYVRNASLVFDLAIVFHTIRHVLSARGAR